LNINKKQIDILYQCRSFIKKTTHKNYFSGLLYLNSWDSNSIGNAFLKYKIINSISRFRFFLKLIKNILGIRFLSNLELKSKNLSFSKYDSIIFSWCKVTDFDDKGNYSDRYFNEYSTANKNFLWFLISVDDKIPENIDGNIQILYRKPSSLVSKLYFVLKTVYRNIRAKNKGEFYISHEEVFAERITEVLKSYNDLEYITKIIQPYEGQPFQHAINILFKDLNIKTIGYLHSLLPALPTDLIYRFGAPDILYVHGYGQIEIMKKFLNWDSNFLRFIPSLRFRENSFSFSGCIYVPYDFINQKVILDSFEFFLKNSEFGSLPFFKIKTHPVKLNSLKHKKLIKRINFLLNKYENRFDSKIKTKISVVIGVSAVILEALENDVKTVIHIVNNPVLDSHQNILWQGIDVEVLSNNVYKYQLSNKKHYIHLGDNNLSLKKLT
jgi:hypothetical protein